MTHRVLKKIFQKNRLDIYRNILHYFLERDYIICSLQEWYSYHRINNKQKILILRHDVDLDPDGAYNFFLLEKELHVTSTFYFRWKTIVPKYLKVIHAHGFEVSLHYETLATYIKKKKIHSKQEITREVLTICREKLSEEIKIFENKFFKIHTLCSHGDKRNRLLGIPNHVLVDEELKSKHNILFEAYDKNILSEFDAYISDSSIYSDFNWKHFGSPYKAADEDLHNVCLLTHPMHWNQNFLKNIILLYKILIDNK